MTEKNTTPGGRCRACARMYKDNYYIPAAKRRDGVRRVSKEIYLDPGPFFEWTEAWLTAHPDVTATMLCDNSGITHRSLRRATSQAKRITLGLVSRVLEGAGADPHELHALYPLEAGAEIPLTDFSRSGQFRDHSKQLCWAKDCEKSQGHGPKGKFCAEHAPIYDKLHEECSQTRGWQDRVWRTDFDALT